MTTTDRQDQFDALVQQIEQYAKQQPLRYQVRLGLLAALGYAYIIAVFLLLFGLVGVIRQSALSIGGQALTEQVNTLTVLLALCVLGLFWVKFSPPQGVELKREEAPQLFAMIDELTQALKTTSFDHVLLTDDLNAGVLQVPRLGFLGWQRNYLLLGLPLMQALSLDQFRAVIAHELGHLSGNHSRFSGWIYRVRNAWFQLTERFETGEQKGLFLFRWFFNWYEPLFRAYSFVLARANEYEADRCSAQLVGLQTEAESQLYLAINAYFVYESFWPTLYQQTVKIEAPPSGVFADLLAQLRQEIDPTKAALWLNLALSETTGHGDTHPCLADRLSALGYTVDSNQPLPRVAQSAAEFCFGEALPDFTARLEASWQAEAARGWRREYHRAQAKQQQLETLGRQAQTKTLTVEQAWQRAYLTWQLHREGDAIALFQAVLDQAPNHPLSNYQLGKILVEQQDAAGVSCLETAIACDPSLASASCQLLYRFYWQQGQVDKAMLYRRQGQDHKRLWQRSQTERSTVSFQDQFTAHQLPETEYRQLAEQIAGYPFVKQAYFVQKAVTLFPEKPLYVLAILRRFGRYTQGDYQSNQELIDHLEATLSFSGQVRILIFDETTVRLRQTLQRVPDALIYTESGSA